MRLGTLVVLWTAAAVAADPARYELAGQVVPETSAAVYLYGATTPFTSSALADARGRFHFHDLLAGTYTLAVFVPARGETRQTIEIGPSLADPKGRVPVTIQMTDSTREARQALRKRAMVSARELSIPERANKEYAEAQKKLSRRDVPGATAHLQRAVEIAPQFAQAWNNLGTIAYQTRRFPEAEEYFRRGLEEDPTAFEPLVNLGGVLLTLGKLDEALKYNLYAVLSRPDDALANSQLGMTYFAVGNLSLAQKYLEIAKRLDPAHFSHPQLTLAEIHLRRNERAAAAAELEDFVQRHPDYPTAPKIREAIQKLRQNETADERR